MDKIERLRSVGVFLQEEAHSRQMRIVRGKHIFVSGEWISVEILIDELDGKIADAKFLGFGPPALMGIGEALCESILRKHYTTACTAEDLERYTGELSKALYVLVNGALEAVEAALQDCLDLPAPIMHHETPLHMTIEGGLYPGWTELQLEEKLSILEELFAKEIRPYIALDAGDIEIVSLQDDALTIRYQGTCTTCPSSIGSTLQAIQHIVSQRIHPNLQVLPDQSIFLF